MIARVLGKNLHRWLPGYLRHRLRSATAAPPSGPRHLLFALCDHYEPLWGGASASLGEARVRAWEDGYPRLADRFRDADGRAPQHSFFFPGEQYAPDSLERLGRLVEAGLGEVELHLHHDGDTAAQLRRDLERYLAAYARHGHLCRDPDGRLRYAFIHGNWCLANARKDRRWCGVDAEIPLLYETGCYADFTFPAAPDESQPHIVNQIYWPVGRLERARAYEQGERARVGRRHNDRLLLIEGPLGLAWRGGPSPVRIDNGHLTADDPATAARVRTWTDQAIHVAGRPEWVFVKVHTHGAPEKTAHSLLGAGGEALHRELGAHYNDGRHWRLHYVTAREMYNVALAAMDGHHGNPDAWRNYVLAPPPRAPSSAPPAQ